MRRGWIAALLLLSAPVLAQPAPHDNRDHDQAPIGVAGALSAPDASGHWGFAVGLHPAEAARRGFAFPPDMREVRATGANCVLLPVSWKQHDVGSDTLSPDDETVSDVVLSQVIASAHAEGLRVILMPLIELHTGAEHDWRGVLRPRDSAAWWRTYRAFIAHYAQLAAQTGVAMLVVGSELSSMSSEVHQSQWERLATSVRQAYPGQLAYGANHDALDLRAPWSFVDVVGVSAYFPLAHDSSSSTPFDASWRAIAERLAHLRSEIDKPLIVLEVGYRSVRGAARKPWDYSSGALVDVEEQRQAYSAFVNATRDAPWLHGALFWTWLGPGGAHDRWYTPRNKPALHEAERLFRARVR